MLEKENETDHIGSIDRNYVKKEMIKSFIVFGFICIALFILGFIIAFSETAEYIVILLIAIGDIILFSIIMTAIYFYEIAYWKSFSYTISDKYIRIQSGVFTKSKTTIPFSRIQNINLAQGVFDRIFGLHTVKIETAGKSAGQQQGGAIRPEGYIPGVKDPSDMVQIIDQLVHKYTQTKVDSGIGDYIFEDRDMAFDQFIAYILAKMKEGDELKTRVKELREKQGISQGKLAEEIGVSRQTINYLERGTYMPSLKLAMKLAKFFEIPVEQLFELEEND